MHTIVLIGAGSIGRIHAANLINSDRARLSAVCDRSIDAARAVAADSGALVCTSLDDAIAMAPDAVIIASSTASHGEVARACASAGLPFLCEKPLAFDLQTAIDITADVEAAGIAAAMGFNRRFDFQYAEIRDTVQSGQIGKPEVLLITSRSERPPTPEFIATSGGLFGEKGSHFYDLCRWICGEEPGEVFAMGSVLIDDGYRAVGEADTAVVSLRMPSGVLCQLDFSWRAAYGQDERLEVNCSEGMLQTRQAPAGPVVIQTGRGRTHPGGLPSWRDRFAATYRDELNAFFDLLDGAGRAPALAGLEDGVAAQRIAEAARLSARVNRVVNPRAT